MGAKRLWQIAILLGATSGYASPVPVGDRKYVIRQQQDAQVQIVPKATQVDGSYMRDPEMGHLKSSKGNTAKRAHGSSPSNKQPVVVHTEKAFKPLKVEGKLLQPSVEFDREYIDIAQIESIPEKSFVQPLMESLDALE